MPKRAILIAWTMLSLGVVLCGLPEFATGAPPRVSKSLPAPERVDINHATMDELVKVPGMTLTWAERILRFRPYRTKQDLLDKGIVTSEIYDRIKDYVIAHREKQ